MVRVCVGGPGSGKALQGERLEERLGLRRVSPGDLLCSELQSHSERGRRLRDVLERGEMLPEVRLLPLHHNTHAKASFEFTNDPSWNQMR